MNKIEEKYGLKASHAYALFAILILNITWIVCDFVLFGFKMAPQFWISILMFVAAAFYACYGYKKPHGNHMRYLCLFQAFFIAALLILNFSMQSTFLNINYLLVIILVTYMGARLGRYKQNLIICAIVLICHSISSISSCVVYANYNMLTITNAFACFSPVFVWLAVAGAYITRFKLHKQAGFEDKK